VIQSFADKETEKVYRGEFSKKLPGEIQTTARRKLIYLDEADNLADLLAPPGNRLEALKGNRAGQYSIRINDQWRIVFRWKQPHAFEVGITDYH
jgi:toxin HigB-1